MTPTRLFMTTGMVCMLCVSSILQAREFNDGTITHSAFPAWFLNDPFLELDTSLAAAQAGGKQGLMVFYSTEGCSYCALFVRKNLTDPEIVALLRKNFVLVGLEIFNDADMVGPRGQQTTVKDFAKQEGVMFAPTILFYAEDGRRILRITGYQSPERFKTSLNYVTGKHYQSKTLAEYIRGLSAGEQQPVAGAGLRQDPLFASPPHRLQRNNVPADNPLLVIFDQTDCEDCDIFHDKVLGNQQVRNALKSYEVVRLDSQDNSSTIVTPDGYRMTPAAWFKHEGFTHTPALIFFSEQGHAAIKTDNLILDNRMMNSIHYMNERAYEKGWSYQRFARSKAIERNLKQRVEK